VAVETHSFSTVESEQQESATHCLHCREPLIFDDVWGWVHEGSRYLCRDPQTGELTAQPATLI